jgi:hypothetical protein
MRTLQLAFLLTLALALPALGQNFDPGAPPAATGPRYDVSAGYSYVNMQVPNVGRVNLNGLDVSGHVDFNRYWGATIESNYARSSNLFDTGHQGYVLSFLGGPVFYPIEYRKTAVFVHALVGAGLVDGAVPVTVLSYFHGWQDRFAYAFGGGVERSIAGPLAMRVGGDYLRTSFYNATGAVEPQNNLRVTVSLVFRLNNRQFGGR